MRVVAVWHWQAAWCHSFVRGRRCIAPSEETVSGERLSTQIIGAINFLTLKLQVLKVPCLTSENNPLYCHWYTKLNTFWNAAIQKPKDSLYGHGPW